MELAPPSQKLRLMWAREREMVKAARWLRHSPRIQSQLATSEAAKVEAAVEAAAAAQPA